MKLPPNATLIEAACNIERMESQILGTGTPIAVVQISEAGYGFQQPGIWCLMNWSASKQCHDGFSWDDGAEAPYANGPIWLGDTLESSSRFYVLRTAMTYINNPERYIKIMDWAARRYTKNGVLNLSERGYCPSPYLRIEDAALRRYIVPRVASDGIRKPI